MKLYAALSAVIDLDLDIEEVLVGCPRRLYQLARDGTSAGYREIKRLANNGDRQARRFVRQLKEKISR